LLEIKLNGSQQQLVRLIPKAFFRTSLEDQGKLLVSSYLPD